jgi:hypothetical protein
MFRDARPKAAAMVTRATPASAMFCFKLVSICGDGFGLRPEPFQNRGKCRPPVLYNYSTFETVGVI